MATCSWPSSPSPSLTSLPPAPWRETIWTTPQMVGLGRRQKQIQGVDNRLSRGPSPSWFVSTQVTKHLPFTVLSLSITGIFLKRLINCPTSNLGEILKTIKSNPLILQIKKQMGEWLTQDHIISYGKIRTRTQVLPSTDLPTSLLICASTWLFIHPFIQSVIYHPPYSTVYPFLHPSIYTIHSGIFLPITQSCLPPLSSSHHLSFWTWAVQEAGIVSRASVLNKLAVLTVLDRFTDAEGYKEYPQQNSG